MCDEKVFLLNETKWCKRLSTGSESTEDNQRPGLPVTVTTKINEMFAEIVISDDCCDLKRR